MAKQTNDAIVDIVKRPTKIMDHAFEWLIIERIDRKITTGKVLFDIAPDIVAQNHTILVGIGVVGRWSAKRRHFNQLTARIHMRQLKAATDDTAALSKDVFDLMRLGIRHCVKVFWTQTQ